MRKPYQLQRTITTRIIHAVIINKASNEVTIDEFILPKECVTEKDILKEVQKVYRMQGVEISDKHIEIIVRQMMRKLKITDPGSTDLIQNVSYEYK